MGYRFGAGPTLTGRRALVTGDDELSAHRLRPYAASECAPHGEAPTANPGAGLLSNASDPQRRLYQGRVTQRRLCDPGGTHFRPVTRLAVEVSSLACRHLRLSLSEGRGSRACVMWPPGHRPAHPGQEPPLTSTMLIEVGRRVLHFTTSVNEHKRQPTFASQAVKRELFRSPSAPRTDRKQGPHYGLGRSRQACSRRLPVSPRAPRGPR